MPPLPSASVIVSARQSALSSRGSGEARAEPITGDAPEHLSPNDGRALSQFAGSEAFARRTAARTGSDQALTCPLFLRCVRAGLFLLAGSVQARVDRCVVRVSLCRLGEPPHRGRLMREHCSEQVRARFRGRAGVEGGGCPLLSARRAGSGCRAGTVRAMGCLDSARM